MSDENIDINVNTIVDRESLDQLNGDLTELQDKAVDLEVDTSGIDDLAQSADDATDEVGELDDSLDGVDGGGAKEAANDVSQVGAESNDAAGAVTDLSDVLGLIGGALATGGIIAGIDSIASSADNVNQQMNAMQINYNLDPSGLDDAKDSINQVSADTGVAKGSIRNFVNSLGAVEIGGVGVAANLMKVSSQLSYLRTGSNDASEQIASLFSKSIMSGKMMERAFTSNGISLDQMAARAGYTKEEMISLFESMSEEDRASFLTQYAVDTEDAKKANEGLKDSYDTLKDKFDQKVGALGTAFGSMVLPILLPAVSLAVGAFSFLGDVINGLPDWAKMAGGVIILVGAFAAIGVILWTTVIPAITSFVTTAIIGFANMILPILGVNASVFTLEGAFAALAAAEWMALAPALLVIGAIIAIAAAIYLVGQYFGWWKDIPTMIEAIKAGVMRLWNAFINNKHVQAVIEWLKAAWQSVLDFLQPLFDFITTLWNNIFPPQDGGFDIVNSIINLFGWLGNSIAMVIGFIQANWPLVSMAISPVMIPLQLIIAVLKLIYSNFGTVVSWFQTGASRIVGFISGLKAGWDGFASGVMSAYNTYIKPVLDAISWGAEKATEFWNSITGSAGGTAGGDLSAAGGVLSSEDLQEINYPEKKEYNIYLNGLVTEQSMIDELLRLIKKGDEQEAMRT